MCTIRTPCERTLRLRREGVRGTRGQIVIEVVIQIFLPDSQRATRQITTFPTDLPFRFQ